MSQKITSKNLQYTSTLPPFLARLRGQAAPGADRDGPDPILAAQRRPGKPRSGSAEAEDAPLVVDEQGNTVEDVAVGADGSVKEKATRQEPAITGTAREAIEDGNAGEAKPTDTDTASSGERLAGIGDQRRKRKIGRVVGADAQEKDVAEKGRDRARADDATTARGAQGQGDSAAAAKAKPKKKAKKIKLSFGDGEG